MSEEEKTEVISILSSGIHIPAAICQLTTEAFNGIFEQLIQSHSYEQAYEIIEASHVSIFKKRRYSSYESFRKARSRRIQN